MFVIRWYYALVTVVLVVALYTLVGFLKPGMVLAHVSLPDLTKKLTALYASLALQYHVQLPAKHHQLLSLSYP